MHFKHTTTSTTRQKDLKLKQVQNYLCHIDEWNSAVVLPHAFSSSQPEVKVHQSACDCRVRRPLDIRELCLPPTGFRSPSKEGGVRVPGLSSHVCNPPSYCEISPSCGKCYQNQAGSTSSTFRSQLVLHCFILTCVPKVYCSQVVTSVKATLKGMQELM